ncbi:MAG: winged helix-turn-helix domain-containing protein [Firmicutes bacterium]|nr:winged helix-turn-helix domain-containing protein [Bacillota bacterium]
MNSNQKHEPLISYNNLTINFSAQCAEVGGAPLKLTRLEFNTLAYLLKNKNTAVPRTELLNEIWHINCVIDTRATDDTMKRLRKKLSLYGAQIMIETIRGYGFIVRDLQH